MKRFAILASFALAVLLTVVSTSHAQTTPVYQYFDQSEQFNGSRCESFDDTQNLFANSFTIATYVSVSNAQGRHPFVAHQTSTERGFWLGLDAGKLYVEAYENENSGNFIYAEGLFPVNQWVFVVVKYDAVAGTIQLEQDGQIVQTKTGISTIRVNTETVDLGCYIAVETNPLFQYYLTGKMQGTRFYTGADLSVAQPTPNENPENPTPEPTEDGSNPTPTPTPDGDPPATPTPTDKGGDSDADFEFFVTAPQTFEGNRCVDFANADNIFTGDFTINTQVYLSNEQERHIILSQEREGDRGIVFDIFNGKPGLQIYSSSVDKVTVNGSKDVPLNKWTELTATFDGGTVTLQMNGEEVGRVENAQPMRDTSAPTQFGCYLFNDLNRSYLEGQLQKLYLFDSAKTIIPSITPEPTPTPDPNATETPGNGDINENVGTPGTYNGACKPLEGTDALFSNDWTFSAWVRPLRDQERHPIMSKQGNEERGVLVEIFNGELVLEIWKEGSVDAVNLDSGVQIPVEAWSHVAAKYEGGTLSLWVNGVEAASQTNVSPVASNAQDINLACYEWDEDNKWYMNGQLQDVSITDSAVAVEMGTTPTSELPPPPTPTYEEFADTVQVFNGTTCTTIDDGADIFSGNWTAEFQFRMGQAQARQPLFSDEQDGTAGRGLLFSVEEGLDDPSRKELVLQIHSDDFSKAEIVGDMDIPIGEWVHASVSFNNGTVEIYANDELIASETGIQAVQHPNKAPLRVGCYIFNSDNSFYFVGEMSNARFYGEATLVKSPGTTPIPPTDVVGPTPAGHERGRAKIVDGNVVADNGWPLRGEHVVFANGISPGPDDSNGWSQELMYDRKLWRVIRDTYHLNTVRLMMSRPPQNWFNGPGNDCSPPEYRCYSLDYVHPNGKTTIQIMDDLVEIAADLGMYIVIDYHPVLGHDKGDARVWWGRIAPRYKDHTHVIYELINEPWSDPSYPGDLVDFQQELYQQIRTVAPATHIIAWSFANTRSEISVPVSQAKDIDYGNASVGFHPYEWDGELETMKTRVKNLRQSHPVISTEVGGDRKARVRDLEEMGMSWIGLDNIRGLPGLEDVTAFPDVHAEDEVFWEADPDAVDQVSDPDDPNQAPTLSALTNQTSTTGDIISVQLSATDADGDTLTYTVTGLPAGLQIDANSGLISGRIVGGIGVYTINVSVSDGVAVAQGSFDWSVFQGPMYLPMIASVSIQ